MKFNKWIAGMMTCLIFAGSFSGITAFAQDKAPREEDKQETIVKTVETETEEQGVPLTPDGNLSLIDDIGSSTAAGKQFITMVTKNGNYFYLIIDRNDKGEENVHFLNLVDEADLFTLLDEEAQEKYLETIEEEPIVVLPVDEPDPEIILPEPIIEESAKNKLPSILPIVLSLLFVAGGGFGFFFMQFKKKKKSSKKPDPDIDFEDEDDEEDDEIILPVEDEE